MKVFCIIILLYSVTLNARTNLYREPEVKAAEAKRELTEEVKVRLKRKPAQELASRDGRNGDLRRWGMAEIKGSPIVSNQSAVLEVVRSLKAGQIHTAIISQSLIALHEAKSPVAATVTLKSGEAFTLIGEATLERNTKRILVEFTKLRRSRTSEVFDLKAHALDSFGVFGIEGEHHSGASKFFLAELLSAAAAGYADSSVNRSQNVLGQTIEENSADTNSKKAVATAMNRTADRFAEKVRLAPEFSVLRGPSVVQIIFLDQPTRNK